MSFKGGKYSRKIELKSLKSHQYLRKVFKCYLGIIFSFLNALLRSCICHAARLSILCSQIQIFISKKDFYFANYRFPIRFVLFRFENYSRTPLRKNQQGKKSNIQMVRWKQLKQGVRLSIQQRLVVEHRVQSKMLEDWPSIAEGFPTLFSRVTINAMKNCRIPVKKYFLAGRLGQG